MREFFQDTEIRPWHGDELVSLQKENLDVLQGFFANMGPVIISGCVITATGPGFSITGGLVGCKHADGYKIARLEAASDAALSALGVIYIKKDVVQKEYAGAGAGFKDAVYNYYAVYLATDDPDFLTITGVMTPEEYVIVTPDVNYNSEKSGLGLGIRKLSRLPAFTNYSIGVSDPRFINPGITISASLDRRINEITGEVHLMGQLTVVPSVLTSGVVDTAIFNMVYFGIDYDHMPVKTTNFTAHIQVHQPSGNYNLESHGVDYMVNMPAYVLPSGELHISLMKSSMVFSYTLNFNFSYFFA